MLLGNVVRSDLKRQIEFLRVENQILRIRCPKRIIATASERRKLIKFGLPLNGSIKKTISIVSYSTFRRWVNGYPDNQITAKKAGRPRTTPEEIRALIVRLARENKWGYTRILGELKKLRIKSVSRNTVKNILIENGIDPLPKRGEDSWDEFIKRHFKTLWACDFFTKTVWTALGPKTFHALFFINVHTRKVRIAGITKNPTKEWVNKKAKTISFFFETKENSQKLLVRDGDNKYSKEFDEIFNQCGIDVKRIPYKSPNLNPYAEGWVGTIKRDCLDPPRDPQKSELFN
ncbi:MAG: helix-turn-helix domain-containing protein [Candidatus Omnitrophota bacterium]